MASANRAAPCIAIWTGAVCVVSIAKHSDKTASLTSVGAQSARVLRSKTRAKGVAQRLSVATRESARMASAQRQVRLSTVTRQEVNLSLELGTVVQQERLVRLAIVLKVLSVVAKERQILTAIHAQPPGWTSMAFAMVTPQSGVPNPVDRTRKTAANLDSVAKSIHAQPVLSVVAMLRLVET